MDNVVSPENDLLLLQHLCVASFGSVCINQLLCSSHSAGLCNRVTAEVKKFRI